jgi:uncharacterized protein YbjQ (UPF0145 family)
MRITFIAFSLVFVVGCGGTPQSTRSPSWVEDTHDLGMTAGTPRVLVIPEDHCPKGHSCDILEVVDIHTHATSQDKGFDELRARAAALEADAVVGAEFEHGDGNEPSHLSGMIVRYGKPVPAHVDLGMVDIPSNENDENKGLSELSRRAHEMGGNQVIDVTFEHGEDGAQGHLRGKVIRFTE